MNFHVVVINGNDLDGAEVVAHADSPADALAALAITMGQTYGTEVGILAILTYGQMCGTDLNAMADPGMVFGIATSDGKRYEVWSTDCTGEAKPSQDHLEPQDQLEIQDRFNALLPADNPDFVQWEAQIFGP